MSRPLSHRNLCHVDIVCPVLTDAVHVRLQPSEALTDLTTPPETPVGYWQQVQCKPLKGLPAIPASPQHFAPARDLGDDARTARYYSVA